MANHLSFDMLSRLVDGRESIAEQASARRHMNRCARCRSELEWLQRIQNRPGRAARFELGQGGGVDEHSAGLDLLSVLRRA